MFDAAAFLVYGSFVGLTAVSIGTVLKPFIDSFGKEEW
jgi:hypothetical protein